jgi:NADH-quinone oxidoreductase subunit E
MKNELRARVEDEIAKFPHQRGALLGALHAVQEQHGCVSPELAAELADIFDVFPVEVLELVTFYDTFEAEPRGRHHVRVCTNLSCSLRGAAVLLQQVASHLGVGVGETTPDGSVHLATGECLGACGNAPIMHVDGRTCEDLAGSMGWERAKAALDALE